MTLRVIGAGLGRTGTTSLKLALERLLGAPCYQMGDVYRNPEHMSLWHRAIRGHLPQWQSLFTGYSAAVDWPVASFWRELSAAYPDALIVLSVRDSDAWWHSANDTIFELFQRSKNRAWRRMMSELFTRRFTTAAIDKEDYINAFERHVSEVRAIAPEHRLLEWHPDDGWEPLCRALGVAIPAIQFPHVNTAKEFHSQIT